ncbi:MAG: hypothetical protein ACHQIL_06675 [Steroidobacterales bacterium]
MQMSYSQRLSLEPELRNLGRREDGRQPDKIAIGLEESALSGRQAMLHLPSSRP